LYLLLCLIISGLVCRQQWWLKQLRLLPAAAQTTQTNSSHSNRQLCSLLFILMDHNMVFSYDYGKQKNGVVKNKCTAIAGHFDGYASALEQYRQHCPMRHVQGYPGSHWTSPSGVYLLHIAPRGHQGNSKKKNNKNIPTLLAVFMAVAMRHYVTLLITRWRRSRASLEATGCHHRASIVADSSNLSCICCVFVLFSWSIKKEHQMTSISHLTIGV
jgi:hypothetical protein